MKRFEILALAILMSVCVASVSAQTNTTPTTPPPAGDRTPRINARQRNQQRRIGNGIKSGQLTSKEAAHLEKREAHIQAEKRADKAKGPMTAQERRQLTRQQNRTSRAIYRKKHNARTAN